MIPKSGNRFSDQIMRLGEITMYLAIVLLPLLGAILRRDHRARRRACAFPRRGAVGRSSCAAHARRHAAAIMPSSRSRTSRGHDDHHGPAEPRAAGSRAAEVITTSLLMIAMVLSWIALWRVGFGHQDERIRLFTWIISADLKVDWALRIDTLTAVMLVVVTTVSALVHLYSIGYMADDPYRPRFFAYLSLFTFAMLAKVKSDR